MHKIRFYILLLFCTVSVSSCNTQKKLVEKHQTAFRLSEKLGFQISPKDNLKLYQEASSWLGIPYRYGGNSRKGVDCSGLVCKIYLNVYQIPLERTVTGMYKKNCRKISRKKLKPGDLVFFNTTAKRKSVSHVGIYLKENTFIHATTASGVRLSQMDEIYYKKRWIKGGRIKK
ncbi:NlpC/P60 family protein [uncultured Odoribacter sp.]|uniref:C40 family peptidase n=1 Tax=uncultured Odoribacter sp. TaxID=876416 RepID=UPI0026032F94|nr:NlpC/P60 family protein [uncultured Odoribacter sp.]